MIIRWIPYTFIRIVLFFIGGIALGIYLPNAIDQVFAEVLLTALITVYIILFWVFRSRNQALFNLGYLGVPAIFLAGYVHLLIQTASADPDHLLQVQGPVQYYTAVITKFAEEKERSWKTEAKVLEVFAGSWKPAKAKVVLYFSKDSAAFPFQYGDVILIKGNPSLVQRPGNPGEFDYQRYLAFKNIYHQHFVGNDEVRLLKNDPPSTVMQYAIHARLWADEALKRFIVGDREQAIASALVLGVTDGLDNELLNAYAATGAMHVLAVSGLHITIIYMILLWVLKPLLKLHSGKWILALMSLFILWSYAFITGLSPSVLRAVTMFSFIAVARAAGQNTNIYNTLAASAFCILLFDPYLIMSVGFQLSYLAVLGIVYLQTPLYRLWEPKSRFWDEVWKITCVSIAAQVATFSLGLLYFHQFPNYFLLSNLLVIPGSFLVLILGIVLLATSFIHVLASAVGLLLTWSIKVLNIIVFTVEAFPFSLVENIYITVLQSWILVALTVVFIMLFKYKRFSYCFIALPLVVIFAFLQWEHFIQKVNVRKITVYNVHGHSAIDLIDKGQAYFLTDSVFMREHSKIRFHVWPNRLESGIHNVNTATGAPFIFEFKGGKVVTWSTRTLVHLTDKEFLLPAGLEPDWLVIGNNAVYDHGKLGTLGKKTKIILDSSNSYFYADRILKDERWKSFSVHSVIHEGAFDYQINDSNI